HPALRHVYTMLVVMVGWVLFRADSLGQAIGYLKAMAGFNAGVVSPFSLGWYLTPELRLALVAATIGSTPIIPAINRRDDQRAARAGTAGRLDGWATAALLLVLGGAVMHMAARTYNPFIYFRF